MNRAVLNSTTNSGPSVGASSLVTDANSALSGGPHLQRSTSINTESYVRLPASPMSFSSNNVSISGSSVIDGSSIVQQSPHQDQSSQQMQQRQQQQGASTASSHPTPQTGQVSVPTGTHIPSSSSQEPNNLTQMQKKPRLDTRQEDILQQQVIQQLLQRHDSMQFQGHNPQLQALIQQQRLRQQQQQILQSMPQMQRAHLQQQQHQQLRHHLQQQVIQPLSTTKRPHENGVCAHRLMQYIYHHRHHPPDNSIAYWRKFVAEYFAPRAKKRWCLSLYDNVGHHALGVFPQAAMDAWHCGICNSKTGRGFEATYEVLPRLNNIKFDSGVIDELLFVDMPRECKYPSGIMILEYGKAVQESVYEHLRVVREGQLRIVFTHDLKILSWEFCARRHEELFLRRLVAPQVNQLVQVAQKYQSAVSESGAAGLSAQDLQANCNMFLTAGRQLARHLELQSLNDLGFSKRYVRSLQIAEVVSSMKDLIDFSREHNIGPIEGLKNYPRQASTAKLQMQKMQEMEQLASAQGLPTDHNTLNKLMAMHSGLSNHMNGNHMVGDGVLSGTAQAAVALSNYQNMLRQNSMNSNPNVLHQEASCSFNNSNQALSSQFQGQRSLVPGSMPNGPVNGLSSSHQQQPQQPPHSLNVNNQIQQNLRQSSHGNQNLQPHMIQQLLQDMVSNGGGGMQHQQQQQPQQQCHGGQNASRSMGENVLNGISGTKGAALPGKAGTAGMFGNGLRFGNIAAASATCVAGSFVGMTPNRSNSFKAASNSISSGVGGNNSFSERMADMPQNLHLPEMVQDISHDFTDNGMFNSDPGDLGYGWKA